MKSGVSCLGRGSSEVFSSDYLHYNPSPEPYPGAWQVRRSNFPDRITFYYPRRTIPVTVTGQRSSLNCAHCGGYYLRGMSSPKAAMKGLVGEGVTSFLVSGGCDRQGRIPLLQAQDTIAALAEKGRLNLHVGLVGEAEARFLSPYAERVSFDFVTDTTTIQEVTGLSVTGEDYTRSYRCLREHLQVVPHLCVGLWRGRIHGEYEAVETLKEIGLETLVLIIFTPTRGTKYQDCRPPSLDQVGDFFQWVRKTLPRVPILLGCMRPGGSYRRAVDQLAVRCGLNGIVQPTLPARRLAVRYGLSVVTAEECCVF